MTSYTRVKILLDLIDSFDLFWKHNLRGIRQPICYSSWHVVDHEPHNKTCLLQFFFRVEKWKRDTQIGGTTKKVMVRNELAVPPWTLGCGAHPATLLAGPVVFQKCNGFLFLQSSSIFVTDTRRYDPTHHPKILEL